MGYSYEAEKPFVFTDEGSRRLIAIRDLAKSLCESAGCVRADKLMVGGGSSWAMMAVIDRIAELGDLRLVDESLGTWQYRIFVWRGI